MLRALIIGAIALAAYGGCSKDASRGGGSTDTDTDGDTDTDTDTDTDSDTDTDTDTDVDTDTDTDSDTGPPQFNGGNLTWVVQAGEGPAQSDEGYAIEVLDDGTSYVVGHHTGSAIFGEGEPNATVVEYFGGEDAFLAKFAPDGTLIWVVNGGGDGNDLASDLSIGADGSIFVTGTFQGTAVFGHDETGETSLVASGEEDVFFTRYGSDGALIWARRAGGSWASVDDAVLTVLSDGSVVAAGDFNYDDITFAEGETAETTLTLAGEGDIYLARFDADGALLWAERAGSDTSWGSDRAGGVDATADGAFLVTGYFPGTAVFDEGETTEQSVTAEGVFDCFFARYSAAGVLDWVTATAGSGDAFCSDVADAGASTAVVAGSFGDDVVLGPGETNETGFTAMSSRDLFVARLTATGELDWARHIEGPVSDTLFSVSHAIDATPDGEATITGQFSGTIVLGAGESGETALESAGVFDIFAARYLTDGTLDSAWRAGGPNVELAGSDAGRGVAAIADGSTFVTGYFHDVATFGAGGDNVTQLTTYGSADVFVARYAP